MLQFREDARQRRRAAAAPVRRERLKSGRLVALRVQAYNERIPDRPQVNAIDIGVLITKL